jgi:hypothetical protein
LRRRREPVVGVNDSGFDREREAITILGKGRREETNDTKARELLYVGVVCRNSASRLDGGVKMSVQWRNYLERQLCFCQLSDLLGRFDV